MQEALRGCTNPKPLPHFEENSHSKKLLAAYCLKCGRAFNSPLPKKVVHETRGHRHHANTRLCVNRPQKDCPHQVMKPIPESKHLVAPMFLLTLESLMVNLSCH